MTHVVVFLFVLADGLWLKGRFLGWVPNVIGRLLEGEGPVGPGSESTAYLYSLSVVAAVLVLALSGLWFLVAGLRRK